MDHMAAFDLGAFVIGSITARGCELIRFNDPQKHRYFLKKKVNKKI